MVSGVAFGQSDRLGNDYPFQIYKCSIRIRFFFGFFGFNGIHCCNSCGDGDGVDDVVGVADDGNQTDMNHDDMIHNTSPHVDYGVDYNHGYRNNVHGP